MTIWKFDITDQIDIELPKDSVVLTVQVQNNRLCLWVLLDPSIEEKEIRHFIYFGTGHTITCSSICFSCV